MWPPLFISKDDGIPQCLGHIVGTHKYSLNEAKGNKQTMYKYTWNILEVKWQN